MFAAVDGKISLRSGEAHQLQASIAHDSSRRNRSPIISVVESGSLVLIPEPFGIVHVTGGRDFGCVTFVVLLTQRVAIMEQPQVVADLVSQRVALIER